MGSLLGLLTAYIWFWLTQNLFTPMLYPRMVRSWLGKAICMHDLSNVDNIALVIDQSIRKAEGEAKRD